MGDLMAGSSVDVFIERSVEGGGWLKAQSATDVCCKFA